MSGAFISSGSIQRNTAAPQKARSKCFNKGIIVTVFTYVTSQKQETIKYLLGFPVSFISRNQGIPKAQRSNRTSSRLV